MAIDRPTLSENWHRVADLKPRLRVNARVTRQVYRGELWYVIEDAIGGRFLRVNQPVYRLLGLLDGRRTVDDAWKLVSASLGDAAPTQGETVQMLGQLHGLNLVASDKAGNVEALIEQRRKRIGRETRGFFTNLLFARVPLWNPDRFLELVTPFLAWMVSPIGALLWFAIVALGAAHLIGDLDRMWTAAQGILATENLVLLYLTFGVIKALHELGHGVACKVFGRRYGGCEVPTLGIMLLVLLPVPYIDASSAWTMRSKWRRAGVAAAGIVVELAIAAIAAIVWARSAEGTLVAAIAYNAMFVASVSTILFNANPLLRFDGYHVLSDLMELPNLGKRANDQVLGWIKKRAWKVRNVVPPSDGMGEAALLSTYAVSAFIYRILIVIGIILFIADQRLLLGLVLVGVAIVGFLIVPSWKGVSYLLTSPELGRTRPRALLTTGLAVCSLVLIVGVVPMPDHVRVTGLVEAEQVTEVYAETPGFLRRASPGGSISRGSHIVTLHNDLLSGRLDALDAELRRLDAARRSAMREGAGSVQIVDEQIAAYRSQRGFLAGRLNGLVAQSEIDGHWIPAQPHQLPGAYVQRGEFVGRIIDPSTLRVRALAGQAVNALIVERGTGEAELRVRGRPEDHLHAQLLEIRPAGEQSLPSVAMSLAAGGPIQTAADDPSHLKAAEPFFELLVQLPDEHQLLPGQRVVVRIALQDKPLAARVWRYTRQLFQQRLRIG